MDWLYPLSGFVVGAIVGLTGMGGGSLMTPLLILFFGVHPLTAVGTDLLYAAVTKTAGTAIHYQNGNVDWRVAGLLAAGSVPATVLTIWVLSRMPKQSPTTAAIISISIGVALIIAAVAIFFRRRIRDYALARADRPTRTRYSSPITVVFGALLGTVVSLCSVGAGALGVAVLFFLYPRLPPVRIVGSDLAHAVPLTLVAGLGHWIIGSVDWHIVGALLLGSLPGIYIGSHLAAYCRSLPAPRPGQYVDAAGPAAHRLMRPLGQAGGFESFRQITSDPCSTPSREGSSRWPGSWPVRLLRLLRMELRAEIARKSGRFVSVMRPGRGVREGVHTRVGAAVRGSRSSPLQCDRRAVCPARRADRRRPTHRLEGRRQQGIGRGTVGRTTASSDALSQCRSR